MLILPVVAWLGGEFPPTAYIGLEYYNDAG